MLNWLTIAITLSGGLAIFLYGMNLMGEGLNKSAGNQIRNLLHTFTRNRFTSFLTGTVTTGILQSSSAVSVMVISLVKAGIMKFPQTFGILLGAGIGTTITAQIIAFKISDYALLIIALGFFTNILFKKKLLKLAGSSILGFGLLFYGLHLMSDAMLPLRNHEPFLQFLTRLEKPWAGLLAGFVFTAMIQSSSAFIGIIIVLSSQGLLNLDTGISLLLGSNIGTTITAIIASFNAGYESKRVALAFFMIKLLGAIAIVLWIPGYAKLVTNLSDAILPNDAIELPRLIANAHTIFNVLITLVMLPFTNLLSKLIIKLIPAKGQIKDAPVKIRYIDEKQITFPGIALVLAKKEVLHMGEYVSQMLEQIIVPFTGKKGDSFTTIRLNEEKVDFLRKEIAIYLTNISRNNMDETLAGENFRTLYINTEIEEIADIISGTLLKKAEEWVESDKSFSEKGKNEILEFHKQTLDQFNKMLKVVDPLDEKAADTLKKEYKKLRQVADELKYRHFERLSQNITESVQSSKLHMELMGSFRMIHSHIANILRIIVKHDQIS